MFSILLATYGTIESGRTKHSEQRKATVSRLRHARKIYDTIVEILEQNLANNPKLDGRSSDEFPPSLPGAIADNRYYQVCWVKRYLDKVFSIQASIDKLLHFSFSLGSALSWPLALALRSMLSNQIFVGFLYHVPLRSEIVLSGTWQSWHHFRFPSLQGQSCAVIY